MRSVPSSRPEKAATRGCGTALGAQSGIAALSYCQCAGGDGSKGATEGGRGRAARDARAGRGTAGGKTGSARDKSKVEISESIVVDGALKPAEFGSGHSGPSRKSLFPLGEGTGRALPGVRALGNDVDKPRARDRGPRPVG